LVFAQELQKYGFEVEVITGFPNYPGGKIYDGYKIRFIQQEIKGGVLITRLPLYPSHSQSTFGRIFNYISFATSALFYGVIVAKKPDVVYAYHPPLTVGITASLTRFFRRVPVVYDIQDMWPDSLQSTGIISNYLILAIVGKICKIVYDSVDHIAVHSLGFKKLLIARGVPERKIDVIYNWCDEASMCKTNGELPKNFPDADRFIILYAGNMGKAQALDSVLEAAEIVHKKAPAICFVFIGSGIELDNLQRIAKTKRLYNVRFIPAVPMSEIGMVLEKADVLLVHLKKDSLFTITIPSKTQAYMAVGKPLIMAVHGDVADLVKEANCGVIAEPENPEAIANAALKLYSLSYSERRIMAERSKQYYQSNLSLSVGVGKFVEIFKKVVK
jgi:colanic acid biosynthesis glycosyl transferase WcaI